MSNVYVRAMTNWFRCTFQFK